MRYGKRDNEIADKLRGKTALGLNVQVSRVNANSDAFLNSPEWKKLRRKAVRHYGRECMKCGRTPKNPKHTNVDHIRSRKHWPSLALDFRNLQVLCGGCNKKKGNNFADYRHVPKKEYDDPELSALIRSIMKDDRTLGTAMTERTKGELKA